MSRGNMGHKNCGNYYRAGEVGVCKGFPTAGTHPRVRMEELERRQFLSGQPLQLLETTLRLPAEVPDYGPVAVVGHTVVYGQASGPSFGQSYVDFYDADTRQWSATKLDRPVGAAVTTVGDKAIFAGGDMTTILSIAAGSDAVEIYDGGTGQWSTAKLSQARLSIAAVTVGNKALFAGGLRVEGAGGELDPYDTVDIYDNGSGLWSTAKLSRARGHIAATVVGDKAIFAGGFSDAVDIYDGSTGQWSTSTMPNAASDYFRTALSVDHFALFVASGAGAINLYDANTGLWSTIRMPHPRYEFSTAVIGDSVIFAGGRVPSSNPEPPVDFADIYNAITGQWITSTTPFPIDAGSGATLGDKAVFSSYASPNLDVYDASTGQWSSSRLASTFYDPRLVSIDDQVVLTSDNIGTAGNPFADTLTFTPIAAPANPNPSNGAVLGAAPTALTWAPSAGAESYDVYVDDALVQNVASNQWSTNYPFVTGLHSWRVVARIGSSVISGPSWNFDVAGVSHLQIVFGKLRLPLKTAGTKARGSLTVAIGNIGNAAAARGWTIWVAASTGKRTGPATVIGSRTIDSPLGVGESMAVTIPLCLPILLPGGRYNLVVEVDTDNAPVTVASRLNAFARFAGAAHGRPRGFR